MTHAARRPDCACLGRAVEPTTRGAHPRSGHLLARARKEVGGGAGARAGSPGCVTHCFPAAIRAPASVEPPSAAGAARMPPLPSGSAPPPCPQRSGACSWGKTSAACPCASERSLLRTSRTFSPLLPIQPSCTLCFAVAPRLCECFSRKTGEGFPGSASKEPRNAFSIAERCLEPGREGGRRRSGCAGLVRPAAVRPLVTVVVSSGLADAIFSPHRGVDKAGVVLAHRSSRFTDRGAGNSATSTWGRKCLQRLECSLRSAESFGSSSSS
jgi:hypothetical protein